MTLTGTSATSSGPLFTSVVDPLHAALVLHDQNTTRQQDRFRTRLCFELATHGVASLRVWDTTTEAVRSGLAHLRTKVHAAPAAMVAIGPTCSAALRHTAHHPSEVDRLVLLNPAPADEDEDSCGGVVSSTLIVHGAGTDLPSGPTRALAQRLVCRTAWWRSRYCNAPTGRRR
ncbi:hypothetical protein GCM10022267_75460 [Lentzea roselyniae]|uniref:Tetrapyrrole (Corrin/Porphyrin) Methylases n=1 Tax=Lentzea roselyniae TaxID=531940 RepID=A0ABP7C2D0_9PSEU